MLRSNTRVRLAGADAIPDAVIEYGKFLDRSIIAKQKGFIFMQTLSLYNTLSAKKEPFEPIDPEHIKMYVCGPTVYNYIHIGNARPPTVFDVLFRVLQAKYPKVTYARNITDVDDKINKAAQEQQVEISEIAERFAAEYHEDVNAVGSLTPTLEPRATHNIDAMIELIEQLISRGHAYAAEGHVLFHIPSMKDYGALSKRSVDDMIAGARVEVAPFKKHPGDFVLWKPSTDDLPGWDSPWGRGRPGWHLECSAMIRKHLGSTIDIHGGGQDLVFPHHENEIAQGKCCEDNQDYVKYWLHNGYITVDHEKMSKSLGNFTTVRELRKNWDGEVIRYALLSSHYRSPLNWSEELLQQAKTSLSRLYQALRQFSAMIKPVEGMPTMSGEVEQSLCDDINTPLALAALHGLVKELNKTTDEQQQAKLVNEIVHNAWFLGLLQRDPEAYFTSESADSGVDAEHIENLIAQRKAARANKDYAESDRIRDEITALGIELEDSTDGTRWKVKGS